MQTLPNLPVAVNNLLMESLWINLGLPPTHMEGQNWLKLLKITALSKNFL